MLTLKIGDIRKSGTAVCSLFLGPSEDAPEIDSWYATAAEIPSMITARKLVIESYLGNGTYRVTQED